MKTTLIIGILTILGWNINGEEEWRWKDNARNGEARSGGLRYQKSDNGRYNVYENSDFDNRPINDGLVYPDQGFVSRPQIASYPNDRPYNQRPLLIQNNRPGGVYGNGAAVGGYGRPNPSNGYYPNEQDVLTGPIPSWVKEGPFKNYDTCKCTEKFNCRSPGISYGHCDVGKKYCCYNRNKIEDLGSDYPQKPINSVENGILVGPGGPVGNIGRPGLVHRPGDENGILVGPGGPIGRPGLINRPGFPENGVLVGPGRPGNEFDRPGRPGGFGRPGLHDGRPDGYGAQNGVLVGPNRRPYDRRDY